MTPFGIAGRPRRVEDVCEVRARARHVRGTVGGALLERRRRDDFDPVRRRDLSVVGVEDDQRLDRRALGDERRPQARLRLARDEAAQAGVARDRAEASEAALRVERDVGRARLQDPVDRRPAPRATCRGRGRPGRRSGRLRAASRCARRFAVASRLRVCHRSLAVDDRRPRREALRGGAEQVVNERRAHSPRLRAAMLYWISDVPE